MIDEQNDKEMKLKNKNKELKRQIDILTEELENQDGKSKLNSTLDGDKYIKDLKNDKTNGGYVDHKIDFELIDNEKLPYEDDDF